MNELLNSPMFGILLTLITFEIGLWIQKKTKLIFLNPLLLAVVMIILFLSVLQIDLKSYQVGGNIINMFLGPATVVLAVPLYQQLHNLKHYFKPIMVGIIVGVFVGVVSTTICSLLFQLQPDIIASLMPKSITTPIGIEVSAELGGIPAITVMAILVTGIFGAVIADPIFRFLRIEHPIAKGIALGTSAHAVGTTKALSLGNIEGAMSSLAIGVSGILTVFVAPLIWQLITPLL